MISNISDFVGLVKAGAERLRGVDLEARSKPAAANTFGFWYRGQRIHSWDLQPKVFRSGTQYGERDLTNRFRALSRSRHVEVPAYDQYGPYLALMQHYGLPTRLLDWSTSPLIALYFAIERYMYGDIASEDAAVWILDPYVQNISDLGEPTTPSIEGWSVRKFLRPAFTDLSPSSRGFRNDPNDYLKDDDELVCAVMAPESDIRIFVQQGCFTIHTSPKAMQSRNGASSVLEKIRIPAESIGQLAEELACCGFRKSTVYPDLTNLAEDLRLRHE